MEVAQAQVQLALQEQARQVGQAPHFRVGQVAVARMVALLLVAAPRLELTVLLAVTAQEAQEAAQAHLLLPQVEMEPQAQERQVEAATVLRLPPQARTAVMAHSIREQPHLALVRSVLVEAVQVVEVQAQAQVEMAAQAHSEQVVVVEVRLVPLV